MKVWIVYNAWEWNGSSDDFRDCYWESVEKIVDSEEKAIKYIQDELRPLVEFKAAVKAAQEKFNCDECSRCECNDCLVAKEDQTVDIDEVPNQEFIRSHSDCIAYIDNRETQYYFYKEYEVE